MRYLVRQRLFSFNDSFNITDESGRTMFQIEGKVFSLGNKLNIYDTKGNNCIYIEQKLFRFLPEYEIYENERLVARLKKQLTFFRSKIDIESEYGSFTIDGDVFSYNFSISRNGKLIATVNKKLISFSDSYAVDIAQGERDDFVLALVIVVDQIFHDNNHNKS